MPTTLTLKNIPDQVYDRLKASAEMHRRSLNGEGLCSTVKDCEFVALAMVLGVKPVTEDKKLLKAFPRYAIGLPPV